MYNLEGHSRCKQVGRLLLMLTAQLTTVVTICADTGPWAYPVHGGTPHWYSVHSRTTGITWTMASNAAASRGGHLATVTSDEENDYLYDLCDEGEYWNARPSGQITGPWLGGMQAAGAPEPDGGWIWITGESLVYSNWATGQPDDFMGLQSRLHFGETAGTRLNKWNDERPMGTNIMSYIVEYETCPKTVGLLHLETNVAEGYILFPPSMSTNTYLIDNTGRQVHVWPSAYLPGQSAYLMQSGTLLRTAAQTNTVFSGGGEGGRVEMIDWDGNVTWAYDYSTTNVRQHHDIERLPNGNILMIAWEYRSSSEAVNMGRDPTTMGSGELWPDHVIEVAPTGSYGGNIVWEWHVWDHLIQDYDPTKPNYGVVSNHPERININFMDNTHADWNHMNGIDYNTNLDQIVLSVRQFSEIWVIDHSTTAGEAATSTGGTYGAGGDLLYRWGNPQAYSSGTAADQTLFVQHNAQWIETGRPGEGHILIYNNGEGRPAGNYSTVDEIEPPMAADGTYTQQPDGTFGPDRPCWSYEANPPPLFYSSHISGAQRQPNGNTLVCEGENARLFEVTADSNIVWNYVVPLDHNGNSITQGTETSVDNIFRAEKYSSTGEWFAGVTPLRAGPLETYPGSTDFDADGMEDTWETNHGLNPSLSGDWNIDADNDGFSNYGEYLADTNPTNTASVFTLAEPMHTGGITEVSFTGSAERVYALERIGAIGSTQEWQNVIEDVSGTAPPGATVLRDLQATNGSACYRVRVSTP